MKKNLLPGASALLVCSLMAAEPTPKDVVLNAARQLAERPNYAWKATVTVPEGSQWRPGPTEGKTEKDGFTVVTYSFGDNKTETVFKGDKGAINTPNEGWQSAAEMENNEGPGRFFAMMLRGFKAPAAQATELAKSVMEFKKTGEAHGGDLTEDQAKALLVFRGRGGDSEGPSVTGAKGSVKFWTKEGLLVKYEFTVKGKVTWNENERDVDRTTTVEIKDVGTTKLTVPEEAKKKLQ